MKALLKVMESKIPDPEDINTLLVATRELNKKVPKGENLLSGLGDFGNFGIDADTLQNIGLPESGDIVIKVDDVPHIRTSFGKYLINFLQNITFAVQKIFCLGAIQ